MRRIAFTLSLIILLQLAVPAVWAEVPGGVATPDGVAAAPKRTLPTS